MKTNILIVLFISAVAVLASPIQARSPYAVKETHFVPRSFKQIGYPSKDHVISLAIGLKQGNVAELERHIMEVSDPDHERYGDYLSDEQVHNLVRPQDETIELVHQWLTESGVPLEECSFSKAGDFITCTLPVLAVELLLDTEYGVYEHEDGTRLVRTTKWSLPIHLHEHISTIQPTTAFLRRNPHGVATKRESHVMVVEDKADLNLDFTPKINATGIAAVCNFTLVSSVCLRTIVGSIDYKVQAPGKTSIGINNFLAEIGNVTDTQLFLKTQRPEAVGTNFSQVSIAGGPVWNGTQSWTAGLGIEANLDIETVIGVAWPIPATVYSTGGLAPFIPDTLTPTDSNEPYLTWANYAVAQSELPNIITTSYGDDEQSVPYSYAAAVCQQFSQLAARGISLLFSSGDNGVGANGTCVSNDGQNRTTFLPSFPATCPWVTSVGGTKNYPEVVAFDPRNGFASGGGFSNYFPRPSWQDDVVPAYIKGLNGQFSGLYNSSGRGYPDIAGQSVGYYTVWNGTKLVLDGTSCSSPLLAGVLGLVNDALVAEGKPVLGYLNPWLYKKGYKGFVDVTSGSAVGCNETGTNGFPAAVGWDAVSGWGAPNFPALVEAAQCKYKI